MTFTKKQADFLKQIVIKKRGSLNNKRPDFKIDPYNQIFIDGQPRSLKNSKRIMCKFPNGKPRAYPKVLPSKLCEEYLRHLAPQVIQKKKDFDRLTKGLSKPYHLMFQFFFPDKRKRDYGNMTEAFLDAITLQSYKKDVSLLPKGIKIDMLTPYQWIEDDTTDIIVPYYAKVKVNKEVQGILLTVLPKAPDYGIKGYTPWN